MATNSKDTQLKSSSGLDINQKINFYNANNSDISANNAKMNSLITKTENLLTTVNQSNKELLKKLSNYEFFVSTCVDKVNMLMKLNVQNQEQLNERLNNLEGELEEIQKILANASPIKLNKNKIFGKEAMAGYLPSYEQGLYTDRLQAADRRKFSFPATLHQASLLDVNVSARRRLSNVSDVVSRKLSYTIGWKSAQIPVQDIITQGKCLCGQYIKRRLRRSGLFNRKLGLQRIRSILGTSSVSIVREVFPSLMILGDELERLHPRTYNSVARQICRSPGGEIQSPETVPMLVSAVARELFRNDITWGKIISLFAVAGGLAVDCVRQGHPDYLPKLVEGVAEVIEDELVPWINENGGWIGLNNHVYPANNDFTAMEWTTLIVGCIVALLIIGLIVRFIAVYLLPFIFYKTS